MKSSLTLLYPNIVNSSHALVQENLIKKHKKCHLYPTLEQIQNNVNHNLNAPFTEAEKNETLKTEYETTLIDLSCYFSQIYPYERNNFNLFIYRLYPDDVNSDYLGEHRFTVFNDMKCYFHVILDYINDPTISNSIKQEQISILHNAINICLDGLHSVLTEVIQSFQSFKEGRNALISHYKYQLLYHLTEDFIRQHYNRETVKNINIHLIHFYLEKIAFDVGIPIKHDKSTPDRVMSEPFIDREIEYVDFIKKNTSIEKLSNTILFDINNRLTALFTNIGIRNIKHFDAIAINTEIIKNINLQIFTPLSALLKTTIDITDYFRESQEVCNDNNADIYYMAFDIEQLQDNLKDLLLTYFKQHTPFAYQNKQTLIHCYLKKTLITVTQDFIDQQNKKTTQKSALHQKGNANDARSTRIRKEKQEDEQNQLLTLIAQDYHIEDDEILKNTPKKDQLTETQKQYIQFMSKNVHIEKYIETILNDIRKKIVTIIEKDHHTSLNNLHHLHPDTVEYINHFILSNITLLCHDDKDTPLTPFIIDNRLQCTALISELENNDNIQNALDHFMQGIKQKLEQHLDYNKTQKSWYSLKNKNISDLSIDEFKEQAFDIYHSHLTNPLSTEEHQDFIRFILQYMKNNNILHDLVQNIDDILRYNEPKNKIISITSVLAPILSEVPIDTMQTLTDSMHSESYMILMILLHRLDIVSQRIIQHDISFFTPFTKNFSLFDIILYFYHINKKNCDSLILMIDHEVTKNRLSLHNTSTLINSGIFNILSKKIQKKIITDYLMQLIDLKKAFQKLTINKFLNLFHKNHAIICRQHHLFLNKNYLHELKAIIHHYFIDDEVFHHFLSEMLSTITDS